MRNYNRLIQKQEAQLRRAKRSLSFCVPEKALTSFTSHRFCVLGKTGRLPFPVVYKM